MGVDAADVYYFDEFDPLNPSNRVNGFVSSFIFFFFFLFFFNSSTLLLIFRNCSNFYLFLMSGGMQEDEQDADYRSQSSG